MTLKVDPLLHLLGHRASHEGHDGFGQSLIEDLRFAASARRMKRQKLTWQKLSHQQQSAVENDPFLGRFADFAIAIRTDDDQASIVLERLWHSWPDPPRFALFTMRRRAIMVAADFDCWPAGWTLEGEHP